MPTLGSMFSGCGLLDLGLERAGFEVIWQAEVDPQASKVLAHHWSGVPNLGDVTEVDWFQQRRYLVPNHRCDEKAAAMYRLYCTGLSLAEVAAKFGVTRQTVHKHFASREWAMRPVRPPDQFSVEFNGRKYSLKENGYLRATTKPRTYLHDDVWEQHYGPVPPGWEVHHHDHDKLNNEPSNLRCLSKSAHASLHAEEDRSGVRACSDCGGEVMPTTSPAVDVLCGGGWP